MQKLIDTLVANGYPNITPIFDGTIHRFSSTNKTNNIWFIGWEAEGPKGKIYSCQYGDWTGGLPTGTWRSDSDTQYTEEEAEKVKQLMLEATQKQNAAKLEAQAAAAIRAKEIWDSAQTHSNHSYLDRKGFPNHQHKQMPNGELIIPIYYKGEICSLQFISADGSKRFLPGGKLSGGYHNIQPCREGGPLYIAEGYATALSIFLATGCPTKVCFTANNLVSVAKYLEIPTIVCADNDYKTPGNPGLTAANKAAAELNQRGVPNEVVHPPEPYNDFNDLHQALGLDMLSESLKKVASAPLVSTNTDVHGQGGRLPITIEDLYSVQVKRIAWKKAADADKPTPPSQNQIAEHLLEEFGDKLIREEKDVFLWANTHWKELSPVNFKHFLRTKAMEVMGGKAKDKDLNAFYNIFMDKMDRVPPGQSMYKQQPNVCNFLDGTLHLIGKKLEFHPHSKDDLITWVLPHEYKAPRPKNQVFQDWLDRAFKDDPQKDEKIRALKQIGGSCLIPVNPCFAFFFGEAQAGKSTFALLCYSFVGEENLATISPGDMNDSKQVETMINKRVNICTDLGEGETINSGLLKRITDKRGISVKRIWKQSVIARLPFLHIFCGNSMPKGLDGVSKAMDRRVTVIEMLNPIEKGAMQNEYEKEILKAGPGDVLDFFEEGLRDLVASGGFYANPGWELYQKWKLENDPVGQFLLAIKQGEIEHIIIDAEKRIRQHKLYEKYVEFLSMGIGSRHPITRQNYYKQVRDKGYQTITVKGLEYFKGISILGEDSTIEV